MMTVEEQLSLIGHDMSSFFDTVITESSDSTPNWGSQVVYHTTIQTQSAAEDEEIFQNVS